MKTDEAREIEQSLELLERALATRSPCLSPRIQTGLRAGFPQANKLPVINPMYGVSRAPRSGPIGPGPIEQLP